MLWNNYKGFDVSSTGIVKMNGITLPQYDNGNGYKEVKWKGKNHYVHRLVAGAFIPNPDNLPMVNHKDETPSNNTLENLEWCNNVYNVNYGTAKERLSEAHKKPVYQYTTTGTFIKKWDCADIASKELGISRQTISKVCNPNDRHKTAGGFIWAYKSNEDSNPVEKSDVE